MKRRRRKIKAITMIELGVGGVLLLLLVLLVYWYVDGLSAYKPNSEVHQYFCGNILEYSADSVYRESKEGVTVSGENGKMPVIDTPFLYKGETKITLPCNMLLMVPSEGTELKRINRFTTVTEESGRVTYLDGKKSAQSYGGFLYDGSDLYVFLEETTLIMGNISVDLPPLSYVKVRFGQSIEYHNSETDEDKLIGTNEVSVTSKSQSGFELNLGNDVLYKKDGGEMLLYSAVDNVEVIEMQ